MTSRSFATPLLSSLRSSPRWLLLLLVLSGCTQKGPFVAITDVVGEIEIADGYPSVTRNARPYILDEQSRVFAGDILRTDARSRMTIKFSSGHTISLHPGTQLMLASVEQRGNEYRSRFSLNSGSVEISGAPSDTQSAEAELTIRTSIAEISAYSGSFWLGYDRGEPSLTVIALDDSGMTVSNADGNVELALSRQSTTISPGAAPGAVTTWSRERVSRTIGYYERIENTD